MRPLSRNASADCHPHEQANSLALLILAIIATTACTAGCAGGIAGPVASTSPTPTPPAPTPSSVNVIVTPAATSVLLGNAQIFISTVSGSANSSLSWSVNNIPGGRASTGFISSMGVYTAPQILPSPANVTVTAQSAADSTKQASATITILSDITMALTPRAMDVELGAMQPFHVAITSAGQPNTAIRWSLSGLACPTACGSLDLNGNFTAPQFLPAASTVNLTAQSVADPAKQALAVVTITSNFSLQLSAPSSLPSGGSGLVAATLTPVPGSNPATTLSWLLSGTGCSGTSCGLLAVATPQALGGGAISTSATYRASDRAESQRRHHLRNATSRPV